MESWLDIIIPVRNPGRKLLETIDSLTAQTERNFGVVLSDNHSSNGHEHLSEAEGLLRRHGIAVRRVQPPRELGRVQHWNWAHAQGNAEWLKPLFVGDLLLPGYVERVRARAEARSACGIIRCEYETRLAGSAPRVTITPFAEIALTPQQFLWWFPSHGNWIGGPINVAYRRTAWCSAGGYAVQLPACADLNLNVNLILQHGLETIPEILAVFQLHTQRFSHGIGRRRVSGCFELWLILRQAQNYCRNAGLIWPDHAVVRGVARQVKVDYWEPAKQRLKRVFWRQD